MFNEMGLVKFSHHALNYIVELLDGSLICAIMHQRWKEEPRGGDYHKRHRNGPTQGPMQSPFSALIITKSIMQVIALDLTTIPLINFLIENKTSIS